MAIEGLQNLSFSFGELFKAIPDKQQLVVKKIALQAFDGVVKKTPVDTGRARANWGVTIDKPNAATTNAVDKNPKGYPPVAMGAAVPTVEGSKAGQTIYVTNALPYILPLEQGHSKQGSHMVEMTVNEIKQHYGI